MCKCGFVTVAGTGGPELSGPNPAFREPPTSDADSGSDERVLRREAFLLGSGPAQGVASPRTPVSSCRWNLV